MMSSAARVLAALVAVALLSCAASAVTIRVPSEQPTIQQGIDAASEGDTVLVATGYYEGPLNRGLDFGGTNIVLLSETGPLHTQIDCDYLDRAFYFHSGENPNSVVSGFTVHYGYADVGAGAYCTNNSNPVFENCVFNMCEAQIYGGGMCLDGSWAHLNQCDFRDCNAFEPTQRSAYGGGFACINGSTPLVEDCEFVRCSATSGGAGLYIHSSTPDFTNCKIADNTMDGYHDGVGVYVYLASGTVFSNCEFRGNGGENCVGGGLRATSSMLTFTECVFVDNVAGSGGAMMLMSGSTASLSGCVFHDNVSSWGAGGAIGCNLGATFTATLCTFVGNRTHQVWFSETSGTVEYSILAFSAAGLPVACSMGTENPYIHHCVVYGNAAGDSLCGTNYSDILEQDPLFCNVEIGDVTLCANSPCLPGGYWPTAVGARGQGCSECDSPVEAATWGRLKALYQ